MKIGAVLLAAGGSSRMGTNHKLLLPWGERTVVGQALWSMVASGVVQQVVVVTGHRSREVEQACREARAGSAVAVSYVENPAWADGMVTSVQAGLAHLGEGWDGFFAALGDMPMIPAEVYRTLAGMLTGHPTKIVVPTWEGERGHPVLIPWDLAGEAGGLSGDVGLRSILKAHPGRVLEVPVPFPGIRVDLDTPEQYAAHRPTGTGQPPG